MAKRSVRPADDDEKLSTRAAVARPPACSRNATRDPPSSAVAAAAFCAERRRSAAVMIRAAVADLHGSGEVELTREIFLGDLRFSPLWASSWGYQPRPSLAHRTDARRHHFFVLDKQSDVGRSDIAGTKNTTSGAGGSDQKCDTRILQVLIKATRLRACRIS